jgi:pimeloyl-ACP methyl ester carboxylesterase
MVTMPSMHLPEAIAGLYPFRSRFLNIGGLNYHYIDEGSGAPVVMVHGNPTWSFYYRNLVCALRTTCRAIAVDHIGCGLSDKPPAARYGYRLKDRVADFNALIDHLNLDTPVTLVVHDWGGMIATAWAVEHPNRVARMVMLNTAAFFPPGEKPIPGRLKLIRNLSLLAVPAVLGLNLFARAALFTASAKRLSRPVKAGLIAPYNCWKNRVATLKFVQDIPLVPSDPSYGLVSHVQRHLFRLNQIPKLVIWGARDVVFDKDYFREWKRRFPGAQTHLFEDAGHYILEDKPEQVIGLIQKFLR